MESLKNKNIKKNILMLLIGLIIGASTTVCANSILFSSKDISFSSSNKDFTDSNVSDALDTLYQKANLSNVTYISDVRTNHTISNALQYKTIYLVVYYIPGGSDRHKATNITSITNATYSQLDIYDSSYSCMRLYKVIPSGDNLYITFESGGPDKIYAFAG